jgi:hypothetical protein
MTFISATERIYREIATPKIQAQPARVKVEAKPVALTRANVDELLQRKRSASPEELEYAIAHAADLKLSDYQRNQLGVDLSIIVASRARNLNGRREDPNARFIAQTLGLLPTPFGLIERSFIADILRDGASNIQRCRLHRPPLCDCWSAQRSILWEARAGGEKTPEGWTASRLFAALEELETASRPERQGIPAQNVDTGQATFSTSPARFRWHSSTDP